MIKFNKYYNQFNVLSLFLILTSLLLLTFKGLNFGIDFKGGTLIELRSSDNKINVSNLRDKLSEMNLGYVSVKKFCNDQDFLIKFENKDAKKNIVEEIKINLDRKSSNYENDGFLIKVIKMVGLEEFINNLKDGLDTEVQDNGKNIPRGIKKRIALARAIISDGKIVILDEPTSSLDLDGLKKLYKILNDFRALKKTIIIASHDQNILKSAGIIIDLSVKPIPRIGVRKKK